MNTKPVTYNKGSVLQFTPAEGVIEFTTSTETWQLRMIGYGIVVKQCFTEEDAIVQQTELQPVLADEDGHLTSLSWYLADRRTGVQWRLLPPLSECPTVRIKLERKKQ